MSVCARVSATLTHLHGEHGEVVPDGLLAVEGADRPQRPGSDVDVEGLPWIAGPVDVVPGGAQSVLLTSGDLRAHTLMPGSPAPKARVLYYFRVSYFIFNTRVHLPPK